MGGGCGGWEGSAAASLGFVPLGSRGLWGRGREPCGGGGERGLEGVGGSRPCMGDLLFFGHLHDPGDVAGEFAVEFLDGAEEVEGADVVVDVEVFVSLELGGMGGVFVFVFVGLGFAVAHEEFFDVPAVVLDGGEGLDFVVGEGVEVVAGVGGLEVAHGSEGGEFGAHGVGAVEVGPFEGYAEFFPFGVGACPDLLGGDGLEGEDAGEAVGGVVGGGVEVVDEFGALE